MEKKPEWKDLIVAWKKFFHLLCIIIIVIGCLNTCAGRGRAPKSVTVYYGPSDYAKIDQLLDQGSYEEALEFCMDELEKAQKGSDREMELNILTGEIYGSYIGDREQAVLYLEQAIAAARKNQNRSRLADACYSMSKVYVNLGGDTEEGLEYAGEAEELYRSEVGENAVETADAMLNRGLLYFRGEQWENVLESLEPAEAILEAGQGIDWYTHMCIGIASMKLQKYEKAEEEFLKAKEISQEEEDDYACAGSSLWLGELYTDLGEYRKAVDHYEEALDFFRTDTQYPMEKAKIYNNAAYCMIQESGNWEDGILYGIKACQALEEAGDDSEEIKEARERFKQRLKERYYDEWKPDATDDEYEEWYRRTVLDGEAWEEE